MNLKTPLPSSSGSADRPLTKATSRLVRLTVFTKMTPGSGAPTKTTVVTGGGRGTVQRSRPLNFELWPSGSQEHHRFDMSLSKRIFIDKDSAYEDVRRCTAQATSKHCAQFTFRIANNRRNAQGDHPYWEPFWRGALEQAADRLGVESVNINGGKFLKLDAERAAVLTLAETICRSGERPSPLALRGVSP